MSKDKTMFEMYGKTCWESNRPMIGDLQVQEGKVRVRDYANWRRNKWELQIALWVVVNLKASVMFKNCFKSKCKLLVKVNGRDWREKLFANESRNDDIFLISLLTTTDLVAVGLQFPENNQI